MKPDKFDLAVEVHQDKAFHKAAIDELTTLVNHVEHLAYGASKRVGYMRERITTAVEAAGIEANARSTMLFWKVIFKDTGDLSKICMGPGRPARTRARLYKRGRKAIEKMRRVTMRMHDILQKRLMNFLL